MIKEVGSRCNMGFDVKDHMTIGHALDLIDFETGATVSGAKYAPHSCLCNFNVALLGTSFS